MPSRRMRSWKTGCCGTPEHYACSNTNWAFGVGPNPMITVGPVGVDILKRFAARRLPPLRIEPRRRLRCTTPRVAPKSLDTQGGILLGFPIPTQVSEHALHPNGATAGDTGGLLPMTARPATGLDAPEASARAVGSDPSAESAKGAQEIGGTDHASHTSRFARLGTWTATHFRRILIAWLLVLMIFGFFAVHVESALAGAGWQASNSQSVAARAIIEKDFAGLGATALQVVVSTTKARLRRTRKLWPPWPGRPCCCATTRRCPRWWPRRPASRCPGTVAPRDHRRIRRRTPTRWCRPPTHWRTRSARCPLPASR